MPSVEKNNFLKIIFESHYEYGIECITIKLQNPIRKQILQNICLDLEQILNSISTANHITHFPDLRNYVVCMESYIIIEIGRNSYHVCENDDELKSYCISITELFCEYDDGCTVICKVKEYE